MGRKPGGGASMSQVIIDDAPILFPKVTNPDIFVIMSQEGFEKYGAGAGREAVMLVDSTLVYSRPPVQVHRIPATREAKQTLKRDIVANNVMLGHWSLQRMLSARRRWKKQFLIRAKGTEALNQKAMKLGLELGAAPGGKSA